MSTAQYLDRFDIPFENPFQRKKETKPHFIARCNKSMVGMKKSCESFMGCGSIWSYGKQEKTQSKNAKKSKGHTE
jgi:hypothetical protein